MSHHVVKRKLVIYSEWTTRRNGASFSAFHEPLNEKSRHEKSKFNFMTLVSRGNPCYSEINAERKLTLQTASKMFIQFLDSSRTQRSFAHDAEMHNTTQAQLNKLQQQC